MKKNLIEVFGWYGMAAIVLAYALVSFSFLSADSIWYQLLNGTGAVGIVVVSLYKKAYQPGILNIIWTVIAVIAIFNILSQ
jgi:hypothetical protein